jgi:hypothetical protein
MAPKAPQLNRVGITPMEWEAEGTVFLGCALTLGTAPGQLKATTAITDPVIAVAEQGATDGQRISVTMAVPIAIMKAEGTIDYGVQVMPKATGPGTVVLAAGATAKSCGIHLGAQCATGDLIPVAFVGPNVNGPANT